MAWSRTRVSPEACSALPAARPAPQVRPRDRRCLGGARLPQPLGWSRRPRLAAAVRRHRQPGPGRPGRRHGGAGRPPPAGAPPTRCSVTWPRPASTARPGCWPPARRPRRSPTSRAGRRSRRSPRTCSPTRPWSAWPTCCAATTARPPPSTRPGYAWPRAGPGPLPHRPGQPQRRVPGQRGVPRRPGGRAHRLRPGRTGQRRLGLRRRGALFVPLLDEADVTDSRQGRALERFRIFLAASGLPRADAPAGGRGAGRQPRLDLRDRHRGGRRRARRLRRPLARGRPGRRAGPPLVQAEPARPARRRRLTPAGGPAS